MATAQYAQHDTNFCLCFPCRYGDRLPLSYVARLVAIVWTLIGVILTGLLVGAIAVSLTNETVGADYKLYGAKVIIPLLSKAWCLLAIIIQKHNHKSSIQIPQNAAQVEGLFFFIPAPLHLKELPQITKIFSRGLLLCVKCRC